MSKNKRQHLEVDSVELAAIVERTRGALGAEDFEKLKAAIATLAFLQYPSGGRRAAVLEVRRVLCSARSASLEGARH